jgi:branched-chain amino acid transport system ATP-binding protein
MGAPKNGSIVQQPDYKGANILNSATHSLKVENVSKSFGGLMVIQRLTFFLEEGEILGVIGPNGSGKTTLFNLISGFLKSDEGKIEYWGNNITNQRPSTICKSGIARTFQIVKPFFNLTSLENVMAGRAYGREPAKNMKQAKAEALEILALANLSSKQDITAAHLGLIDRKRLEIARALATRPKLLLLDEVFAGLNPKETEEALLLIMKIKELGITLMIVEHIIKVILGVSDRVIVLSSGNKIFDGLPKGAINDRKVIEAYLGEDFYA